MRLRCCLRSQAARYPTLAAYASSRVTATRVEALAAAIARGSEGEVDTVAVVGSQMSQDLVDLAHKYTVAGRDSLKMMGVRK